MDSFSWSDFLIAALNFFPLLPLTPPPSTTITTSLYYTTSIIITEWEFDGSSIITSTVLPSQVCPDSGDIVALASVLVQAATLVKGLPKTARSPLSSLTRRQYKTTATFVFNMDTEQYYVVEKEPLTETDPYW